MFTANAVKEVLDHQGSHLPLPAEAQRQGDKRGEAETKNTDRAEVNLWCPCVAKAFQMPLDL